MTLRQLQSTWPHYAKFCKLTRYPLRRAFDVSARRAIIRARDTKLGRDAALKVLPEAFAKDGERLARFGREAQVLASLNHPNIASIYGLEDPGGVPAW